MDSPAKIYDSEFADWVDENAPPASEFEPYAVYDPDGDCIEFFAIHATFYANRIDQLLTVYLEEETNRLVGALIKDVSKFMRTQIQNKCPVTSFVIQGQDVQVKMLFIAGLLSDGDPNPIVEETYRQLANLAEFTRLKASDLVPA